MLLELAEWMARHFTSLHLFQYITFRAIMAALTALAVALLLGPALIRKLAALKTGQVGRSDGPQTHLAKAARPTMGGRLILFAVGIATLLWADLGNRYVWVVLAVTPLFGVIVFYDDYRKLVLKDSRGLASRWKYFWQSVFGLGAAVFLYQTHQSPAEIALYVPLFKQVAIPLGIFFVLLGYLIIVGFSNAVNLTDGLAGHLRLPRGQQAVLRIPRHPGDPGCGRTGDLLQRAGWRRPGLPLVQHVSGAGVHGRRGCAGDRRRARLRRADHAPGDRGAGDGRRVRDGNRLGDAPGRLLQAARQAKFPHGADPPSLRIERLARAPGHRALLDHQRGAGAYRSGNSKGALTSHVRLRHQASETPPGPAGELRPPAARGCARVGCPGRGDGHLQFHRRGRRFPPGRLLLPQAPPGLPGARRLPCRRRDAHGTEDAGEAQLPAPAGRHHHAADGVPARVRHAHQRCAPVGEPAGDQLPAGRGGQADSRRLSGELSRAPSRRRGIRTVRRGQAG